MTTLSHEWRLGHSKAGDTALSVATSVVDSLMEDGSSLDPDGIRGMADVAMAYAAIAQAHYAAANIRAKAEAGS